MKQTTTRALGAASRRIFKCVLAGTILFTSCQKKDSGISASPTGFSAQINGKTFAPNTSHASATYGYYVEGTQVTNGTETERLGIGIKSNGAQLAMQTYDCSFDYVFNDDYLTAYEGSGTVILTSVSGTHIKGTFSGSTYRGDVITNGSFDVDMK